MGTLSASPTVVGAVTTLIVIVAVFLAYNANNGLPFVPVYRVSVEIPDAARLTNNNEIRIGGHRVGVVESIDPVEGEDGSAIARLNLKLDKNAEPLPKDSIFRVRYRSSFGLKYLEIVRGEAEGAPEGFTFDGTDDGDVCQLPTNPAQFTSSVAAPARNGCFQGQTEFDDINNTFDTATRTNARTNLEGFGNAFAGRGTSLNDAIYALEPLFDGLKPVARTLADRDTQLRRFFGELADAARIVAPVAEQQAQLFTNMADTFAAISSDPLALQETIAEGVPTLETAIRVLPDQRPFLRDFTALSRELRPGIRDLHATLPVLNEAVEVGTPVLAESTATNRRLEDALRALNRLVTQPTTRITLQRLGETFDSAKPLAKHVVPAQTVCNYWNYWFTLLPEHISERDQVGYNQRVALVNTPPGPVTVDTSPAPPGQVTIPGEVETPIGNYSGLGANGKDTTGVFKPYELPIQHDYLYDDAGRNGRDCHAGQDGYILGQHLLHGQPKSNPASIAFGAPGRRGPTTNYWHRDGTREVRDTRVPARSPLSWKGIGG
jgi:ABC-type transporter Mla subunit MlaD